MRPKNIKTSYHKIKYVRTFKKGLPAISILVSRKMFEFVAEAGVGVVETAMFSTISALLLLVLEVASEVTTTELAAAGTVEAAVEAEAAVVNTVTAAEAAEPTAAATEPPAAEAETAAACAPAAVVEACDATEAADKVG